MLCFCGGGEATSFCCFMYTTDTRMPNKQKKHE